MNTKKWSILLLALAVLTLILLGGLTAFVDPFFHYHKPLEFMQYPLLRTNQRYLNDGIVKHFDYDAIITGSSSTENFKTSECDALFDVNSVKVPFIGGSLSEVNGLVRRGLRANPNIKLIISGLDSFQMEGLSWTDDKFPLYLYDNNWANDVNYLLNKSVLCNDTIAVLKRTFAGIPSQTFDEYSFWTSRGGELPTNRENVLYSFTREPDSGTEVLATDALRKKVADTITKYPIQTAREYPNVQFIYFLPPFSILQWDSLNRSGSLHRELDIWRVASELLLEEENIQFYAFCTDFETITDLNNYIDYYHYTPEINSQILQRIARGEGLLTRDNYEAYWQEVSDFYHAYDYDLIYN